MYDFTMNHFILMNHSINTARGGGGGGGGVPYKGTGGGHHKFCKEPLRGTKKILNQLTLIFFSSIPLRWGLPESRFHAA